MLIRRSFAAAAMVVGLVGGGEASSQAGELSAVERDAVAAVARRTEAFNAHDLDAFLSAHAPDVAIIGYPDHSLGEGHAALGRLFGTPSSEAVGSIEIHGQWVLGSFVVSNETVTEDGESHHIIFIYRIEHDAIASIRLIANPQEDAAGGAAHLSETERAALAAVARRIDGFNAHDVDGFVGAHAQDVGLFVYPDRRLASDRDHLERVFGLELARGEGAVEVREQWVTGNAVISHEQLTSGGITEPVVGIYTVEDGSIAEVRLIETESE